MKTLASLAGKAQFLYLAIPAARFYLRELRNVTSTRTIWTGSLQVTNQLARDLGLWAAVPTHSNGRSLFKVAETAYLHTDSSDYGWGCDKLRTRVISPITCYKYRNMLWRSGISEGVQASQIGRQASNLVTIN